MYRYENGILRKICFDQVRSFCLCERVDEEYARSLLMQNFCGSRGDMTMERKYFNWKKALLYIAAVFLMLMFQKGLGKIGRYVADLFSYDKLDPYKAYAWNFVHHIAFVLPGLIAIVILCKALGTDFGFKVGDREKGTKYMVLYTSIFAGITLVVHILMKINNALPVYDFPLNRTNVLGTLGFNLLLTGPVEETLYRALPITIFVYVLGESVEVKWGITLETILASFLFALAHIKWSLFPFAFEMDYSRFFYAFAQGIISGKAYQDTKSILYPMYMHSISNVMMVGTGYLFLLL